MSEQQLEPEPEWDDYTTDGVGCYDCYCGWKLRCPDDMCCGQYDGGPYSPCGNSSCVSPCKNCNPNGDEGW